jgi:hypothetical protein
MGGCGGVNELPKSTETGQTKYPVAVAPGIVNGTVTVSPNLASENDPIHVFVNPSPGFVLKTDSLQYDYPGYVSAGKVPIGWGTSSYSFFMLAKEITVYAQFVAVTESGAIDNTNPAVKTITIASGINNGHIVAVPQYPWDAQATQPFPRGYAYPPNVNLPADPSLGSSGSPIINTLGQEVRLAITPGPGGYIIQPGSLQVLKASDNSVLQTINDTVTPSFNMPDQNVIITAVFVKASATEMVTTAKTLLAVGNYDAAVDMYEMAYQNSPNDPEAILYSTLGKLGKILISSDVRRIMSGFYFSRQPATLNDLIIDEQTPNPWTGTSDKRWLIEHVAYYGPSDPKYDANLDDPDYGSVAPYYDYGDNRVLPQFNRRIPGYLTPHGDWSQPGEYGIRRIYWSNQLFWALLTGNQNGFNSRIDDILHYVFGTNYAEAKTRAAKLKSTDRVLLLPRLAGRWDLEKYYGSDDAVYIGKAEMDLIFGILDMVKAGFEYLSSYELNMVTKPYLTNAMSSGDALPALLKNIMDSTSQANMQNYWSTPSQLNSHLPFRSNFLKVRDAAAMGRAKTTFTNAAQKVQEALDVQFGNGNVSVFSNGAKTEYAWFKTAITDLNEALRGNGVFYFPVRELNAGTGTADTEPAKYTWKTGAANAKYGVNVSQFFIAGKFQLQNLFTTEAGGVAPVIYKGRWHEDSSTYAVVIDGWDPVTGGSDFTNEFSQSSPYGTSSIYGLQLNTQNLKVLFPKGFEQHGNTAMLHECFDSIPLWPFWATSGRGEKKWYFDVVNDNMSGTMGALYGYYHQ